MSQNILSQEVRTTDFVPSPFLCKVNFIKYIFGIVENNNGTLSKLVGQEELFVNGCAGQPKEGQVVTLQEMDI